LATARSMREGSLVMPTSLSPDAVARVQGRDHLLVGVQGGLGGEVRVRVGGEERVARTPRRCRDPAAARRYRCRVPPPPRSGRRPRTGPPRTAAPRTPRPFGSMAWPPADGSTRPSPEPSTPCPTSFHRPEPPRAAARGDPERSQSADPSHLSTVNRSLPGCGSACAHKRIGDLHPGLSPSRGARKKRVTGPKPRPLVDVVSEVFDVAGGDVVGWVGVQA